MIALTIALAVLVGVPQGLAGRRRTDPDGSAAGTRTGPAYVASLTVVGALIGGRLTGFIEPAALRKLLRPRLIPN